METLRPLVEGRAVVIFSRTSSDPVSHSVKQLFTSYGANPTIYELDEMANATEIEGALLQMAVQSPSVPAIFIGGSFIGGANDVIGHQVRGELGQMLINARAIWVWNRYQQ